MNSERWQQCKQIFQAALDLPRPDRAAYVREACSGDEELLHEINSLLESEQRSDQFLSEAAANYVAASLSLPVGTTLAGRYRILRLIGSGGMGEVYEAEDLELRAPVALKLVRPEIAVQQDILDRFKREVLLARQVTHPNVCRIFDLGSHAAGAGGRMLFLTMELLAGETLSDRLGRGGPMKTVDALPIVQQLASGLAAAHRAGIVHRDFKSGNVILVPDDDGLRVKIMDFGLARAASGSSNARTTLTVAGGLIGTPAYMAPEQIEGGEITPATDIYALGVVMFEMVTGSLPFSGDNPWIVATKRLHQPSPSPRSLVPNLDRTWESVILRCLARNPAERFSNAAEVARALSGEPVTSPKPVAIAPPKKRMLAAVAIAVAILATAILFVARLSRRTLPSGATGAAQYGWHLITPAADTSLAQVTAAASSLDPPQVTLFGAGFARAWQPGQNPAPPIAMSFTAGAQAECTAGVWVLHDDGRHITKWDGTKQQPIKTVALPWPVKSAACLDAAGSRWGFLADQGDASRWIEFDSEARRVSRSVALDAAYVSAALDPRKQTLVFIGRNNLSVRDLASLREIFSDKLAEKLLGHPAAAWSESSRYFAVGFKQLAVYDLSAKRRVNTLTTTGWISGVGWVGDSGVSVMDDRGRFYWGTGSAGGWQIQQEPSAPSVYQPFWIASHYRWMAFGRQGQQMRWEYITPSLAFDLPVSPLDIWSIATSPESSKIAVASKDPRIFMVDLAEHKILKILEGHTDGVPNVKFAGPDRLISASDDKTLRLWDTASGKLLKSAAGHESLVNAFAISPDKQWLVSVSSDYRIKLWRLPELDFVKDIGNTVNDGAAAAFLSSGDRLLVSDWKGSLALYQGKAPDWSLQQRFQLGKNVVYMVCPSDESWWAAIFEGEAVGLWRIPAADLSKAVRASSDPPIYCSTAADGRLTAVQFTNRIEVRSNADGKLAGVYRFAAREGAATAIGARPPMVLAGFTDGHLLAWPLAP